VIHHHRILEVLITRAVEAKARAAARLGIGAAMTEINPDLVEARHEEEYSCEACEDTGKDIIDGSFCYCESGMMLEELDEDEDEEEMEW
jgi:hypothetical protein